MYFITQKEVEALLDTETRALPMPDGSTEYFRGFKIMWGGVDELSQKYDVSLKWLVELAVKESKESGKPFYRTFPNIVGYVFQDYKKAFEE